MERIHIFGRFVDQITSEQGRNSYYEYLNYWNGCTRNTNIRIKPTKVDAEEYIRLKAEDPSCRGDVETRRKYIMLQQYNSRYDWRPKKSGDDKSVGLVSPTGEQLLPNYFTDVFTQFDALNNRPYFIPVFNGDAWALVTLSPYLVLVTEFRYNAIIPERWDRRMFFVQDKETMKWGCIFIIWSSVNHNRNCRHRLARLETIMPCIADEIYEDQLMTEEEPMLCFMTRKGDKVGILTDFGYSPIIFDSYETDDNKGIFRLIRMDRKRARRVDWWHPDGKDLFENIKRRTYKNAKTKKTE